MPLVRFISPTDPRWISTLRAIERELVSDSLVYRYRLGDGFSDGLTGQEGTFSMCSFWYVECLSRMGDLHKARFFFEKMLGYANHLGLYGEELGPQAQHLGNFPQAFTHLALISAAYDLDRRLSAAGTPGDRTTPSAAAWRRMRSVASTGSAGGRTCRSDSGARCARTTRPDGTCWDYLPHDHARSRAYRWGEDGLLGITDRQARLCFALALWNGRDPILKERLFGLTGPEGNHGEDVKELLLLPRRHADVVVPEGALQVSAGARSPTRGWSRRTAGDRAHDPEFELLDTGVFDGDRYFDVVAEYAKASPNDVLIRVTVDESRTRAGHAAPAADAVVPQHLVVGPERAGGVLAARSDHAARCHDARRRSTRRSARSGSPSSPVAAPTFLFTENETNFTAALRRAEPDRRT